MKYYTQTVTVTLAKKLKEKGMSMKPSYTPQLYEKPKNIVSDCVCPTYAEVFDWLLSDKETNIKILPFVATAFTVQSWGWSYHIDRLCKHSIETKLGFETWYEASDAAIEKVLNLI